MWRPRPSSWLTCLNGYGDHGSDPDVRIGLPQDASPLFRRSVCQILREIRSSASAASRERFSCSRCWIERGRNVRVRSPLMTPHSLFQDEIHTLAAQSLSQRHRRHAPRSTPPGVGSERLRRCPTADSASRRPSACRRRHPRQTAPGAHSYGSSGPPFRLQ